jgi:hypothetical protein
MVGTVEIATDCSIIRSLFLPLSVQAQESSLLALKKIDPTTPIVGMIEVQPEGQKTQ